MTAATARLPLPLPLRLLAVALAIAGIGPPVAAAPVAGASCAAAAAAAERRHALPPGLLLAIGKVESGRAAGGGGAIGPWPWSVNIDGQDFSSPDQTGAIALVRRAQAGGQTFIDVGCFQIDLHFHPDAFASLPEAFDPERNAEAAARFLVQLHSHFGDWRQATGAYHSQTASLSGPYRRRVMLAWGVADAATSSDDESKSSQDQTLTLLQGAWRATLPGDDVAEPKPTFAARAVAIPPSAAMLEYLPARPIGRPALEVSARRLDGKGPES